MNRNKNKKAFTIIELIVVIAIIGILVLFAMPRLLGYVQKAQLTRIMHDTKVMETIMEDEIINHGYINYDEFSRNEKKLGALILANKLFEKQGHAKFIEDPVEIKYLASKTKEFQEAATVRLYANNELGVGGPVIEGTEDGFGSVSQKYKIIPKEWEVKSGTRLKGTFYVNEAGKVYYEPDKPIGPNAKPAKPDACVAPEPLPDYTFEHEVGRIAKYHGNAQHLIIPAYFKVDGECWPVRIIGKGAFMKGGFKSIKLPPTLKEIEPGALEDIGLEDEIIIPGNVDKVGPGAFDNNDLEDIIYEGSPEQVKPGAIPPSFPQKDGTDVSVTYKPPTPGQAGITVKPNNSGGVTITGGGSGGVTITGGGSGGISGSTGPGNPHIPPYVNVGGKDKPVTEIGEGAYQGKGLITVDLPFTLEIIEDYAFAGNQLIGVTIPNGIKEIGHYAFGFNEKEKVGNIKGPDTVGTIKTVILKEKEQFNKIDKYGDILEGGSKVNMFKSSGGEMGPDIRLKDHIWVTSAGNVVIDKEYIGNNEDNSALLKDIISNAEELKKENYESVSWGELEKALSNAKSIVNDKDSSKKDIDKALDDLESAIANLKEKPGDKTNLITKIDEANKLIKNDYESGWSELQNALSDANVVVNNPQSTQSEIDRAILDIIGAINKLIMKPVDKIELSNEINEAKKLEKDKYEEDSWVNFKQILQAAEQVLISNDVTQKEINTILNELQQAINNLKEKPTSPGPSKPIEGASDGIYTFYGEVSTANLISGNELASNIGLTAGTAQHSTEPWLKFTRKDSEGKTTTMFVAKKPYRHSISWDQINSVGAVFGKEVTINGQRYKVRLMKGANKNPISGADSDFHNSEWNKIMLPIHEQAIGKNWAYPQFVRNGGVANDLTAEFKHGLGTGANKRYTDADLLTHYSYGNGSYSWTQESNNSYRVLRGFRGVSGRNWSTSSLEDDVFVWRPVLELVSY